MEYLVWEDNEGVSPLCSTNAPGRPGEAGGGGGGSCPFEPDKMCPCHAYFMI